MHWYTDIYKHLYTLANVGLELFENSNFTKKWNFAKSLIINKLRGFIQVVVQPLPKKANIKVYISVLCETLYK